MYASLFLNSLTHTGFLILVSSLLPLDAALRPQSIDKLLDLETTITVAYCTIRLANSFDFFNHIKLVPVLGVNLLLPHLPHDPYSLRLVPRQKVLLFFTPTTATTTFTYTYRLLHSLHTLPK